MNTNEIKRELIRRAEEFAVTVSARQANRE